MAHSKVDLKGLDLATRTLVADAGYSKSRAVAPDLSVSTTFRHPSPAQVKAAGNPEWDPYEPNNSDIYSRESQPTLTRAEKVLTSVIGQPTICYPSGISATMAAILHVRPDVIAISKGYHGVHGAIAVYKRTRGPENVSVIELDDDYPTDKKVLCWVETPLNPTGELRSIEFYAKKVHAVGGILCVDSTFAPPPLQDPFAWGSDMVMHSGTKYFAGHSDALIGTLSVKSKDLWLELHSDRTYTGMTPGSLEAWLILRSLRTLKLRVLRQSETGTALAMWLWSLTQGVPGGDVDGPSDVIAEVWHGALQDGGGGKWIGPGKQMTSGSACFGMMLKKESYARELPHVLSIFTPATSLGGVESLIEQRIVSDAGENPCLVRMSIGLEDFEDLKADLIQGMRKVLAMEKNEAKL